MDSKSGHKKVIAFISRYSMFFILLAFIIILSIISPNFLQVQNLINVVRQVSIVGIMALGMTMIITLGCVDLSAGATLAFLSVIVTTVMKWFGMSTIGIIVGIIACMIAGVTVGFIDGFLVGVVKMPPFIVTLAMTTIGRGAALIIANGKPIGDLPSAFIFIGQGSVLGIPVPIFIFLVFSVIASIILGRTKFGVFIKATGGNEQAAITAGINVPRLKMLTYMLHCFLVSIAAVTFTTRIMSGQPAAGIGFELDAITAAVIGGTSFTGGVGKISGTVIGVLVIGVMNNGLDILNISPYFQQIAKGLIILLAIYIDIQKNKKNR